MLFPPESENFPDSTARLRHARAQKNTGMYLLTFLIFLTFLTFLVYLLTFLRGVKDAQDAMMTHARQCDGVAAQNVCHDLTTLRLVQLVGDSLLKHEHRRLL